jgi:hypothetical protein
LRLKELLSRANIVGQSGLTHATVSSIVANLLEASLVREVEYVDGRVGRPGLLLELNPNYGCIIAVEVYLDRISLVLANLGRETLWPVNVLVDMAAGAPAVLAQAAEFGGAGVAAWARCGVEVLRYLCGFSWLGELRERCVGLWLDIRMRGDAG